MRECSNSLFLLGLKQKKMNDGRRKEEEISFEDHSLDGNHLDPRFSLGECEGFLSGYLITMLHVK
jgi:hypothetical protein